MEKRFLVLGFFAVVLIIIFGGFVFGFGETPSPTLIPMPSISPGANPSESPTPIESPVLNLEDLPAYAPGEILVEFKEDPQTVYSGSLFETKFSSINSLNEKYKIKNMKKVLIKTEAEIANRLYKIELGEGSVESAVEDYKNDLNVIVAEPNYLRYTNLVPNDEKYSEQWAHKITQAEPGWDIEQGSKDIIIAVIDTGVDYNHEDLKDSMLGDCTSGCPEGKGYDFVDINVEGYREIGYELVDEEDYTDFDNEPVDLYGHGTHVAGIVAAQGNNNRGVIGVCPGCSIMPIRAGFLIKKGGNIGLFSLDAIINSIYYAADNGARIISMSFGGMYNSDKEKKALDYAYEKGIILVASAGNERNEEKGYPAAYDNVLSVTATDNADKKALFSSYGYWTKIAAPGKDILSTCINVGPNAEISGYCYKSGTSMAAPYVSGAIGLILSKNPDLKPEGALKMLFGAVDNLKETDTYIGVGRVNIFKSLQIGQFSNAVAKIVSPANKDFIVNTKNIEIKGVISGNNYRVEYGAGIYPDTWSEIDSGINNDNSILVNWDISQISEGFYTVRLIASDELGENIDRKTIYISKTKFEEGWPYFCKECSEGIFYSPVIADLDGDKNKEIVVGHESKKLFALSSKGENFFQPYENIFASHTSPAIDDIDGDGFLDIIFSKENSIKRLNLKDNKLTSFYGSSLFGQSSISDLDNDGKKEIIVSTEKGYLYILNNDLKLVMENPIYLGNAASFPAIGDIDKDGFKEIAIAAIDNRGAKMYLLDYKGENKNGWPLPLSWSWTDDILDQYPLLADLNNDNYLEVVYAVTGDAWDKDGKKIFEKNVVSLNNNIAAVGDLDRNGNAEIVVTEYNNIDILDAAGDWEGYGGDFEGFKISPYAQLTGISLADIINDWYKRTEIVGVSKDGKIYAFGIIYGERSIGVGYGYHLSLISGFPKKIGYKSDAYPAVGDIDNDGKVEIVAGSDVGMFAIETDSIYDASKMDWPMFGGNPQHTECYKCQNIFIRGDANSDGKVDLTDAVFILKYLFQNGNVPGCMKAVDTNDDGFVDISDAVKILLVLFVGGEENTMPAPFPNAGYDSTSDELSC